MSRAERVRPGIGLAALSLVMALGGCQAKNESGEPPASGAGQAASAAESRPDGSAIVEAAREDLARRLNHPIEDVKVLEDRPVYWKTSALGCPDPDKAYQQVLTRGWLIRLTVGRAEYRYHSGEDGPPFTCHPRQAEPPVPYSVD